jgi:hypothetical protein
VVGGVVQRQRVLVTPLEDGTIFRLHLPGGVRDFDSLDEAVANAQEKMQAWMEALAQHAGATQVEVQMARHDKEVSIRSGWGDRIYLGTELIFTAVGRPSPAARENGG